MADMLRELAKRIEELGNKSTQILIFLSFAIVAAVMLSTDVRIGAIEKYAVNQAMRWWVAAIFPTVVGILPVKELRWNDERWYRLVRVLKFVLLWVAVFCIIMGAYRFLRAI